MNGDEIDGSRRAHLIVADFLRRNGCHDTLASFRRETASVGWQRLDSGDEKVEASHPQGKGGAIPSLESLVELYRSHVAGQRQQELAAQRSDASYKDPTELVLRGPPILAFENTRTYSNLHANNILSLACINLPTRAFSTAAASYATTFAKVLCSTAADKNIILSDPATGEMVDMLEGASGPASSDCHTAAVLCVAQNPVHILSRELVSSGMDGKVVVWDLLHRKPIQTLRDHSKFVVRCAFSQSGTYLATCSYDKTVCIYRRRGSMDSRWLGGLGDDDGGSGQEDSLDGNDMPGLLDSRFELVHTTSTQHNPESIAFVRGPLGPSADDPGVPEDDIITRPAASSSESERVPTPSTTPLPQRTWLVYTTRSDCFVHYIALPVDKDEPEARNDDVGNISSRLQQSSLSSNSVAPAATWTELAFNTNVNRFDLHVSYSLLHLTVHPSGKHIAIQTGDHSIPSSGYAPSSSTMSRILLMPILSSNRTTTLWTGVASSGFATNRHAWLSDGSAAWLTSEEGILRLIDTKGKIRATLAAHGAAAAAAATSTSALAELDSTEALRSTTSWSRGGNTIIKDVIVLDENGSVASCGFDRTVRIIEQKQSHDVAV